MNILYYIKPIPRKISKKQADKEDLLTSILVAAAFIYCIINYIGGIYYSLFINYNPGATILLILFGLVFYWWIS